MAETVRRGRMHAFPVRRPRPAWRPRVHPRSFAAGYLLLALLLAGVALAAYALATRPAHATHRTATLAPAQTAGLGTYALKAIAFSVQREYRLTNGGTLVGIIARPSAGREGRSVLER